MEIHPRKGVLKEKFPNTRKHSHPIIHTCTCAHAHTYRYSL